MSSKVENGSLTPLQSLSPPANASPSLSIAHAPPQSPASIPPLATNLQSPSPPSGVVENLSYKNDLNCYCQRLGIPLPLYETTVEGYAHAFRFKSIVSVGKRNFPSPNTFANRKSAEQNAAKVALDHLLLEDEAKSTNLRVYLQKCEGGKSKKDAEQLAALGAIFSLLADPTYSASISQVIKSKFNVGATFYEAKDILDTHDRSVTGDVSKIGDVMPLSQQVSSIEQSGPRVLDDDKVLTLVNFQANGVEERGGSEILVSEKKQDLVYSLHQIEKQVGHDEVIDAKQGDAALPTEAVTISRLSYVNMPITAALLSEPQDGIKLPEAAQSASQQISAPLLAPSPGLVMASDSISSKKRRKRIRQKANKRLRAENKEDGLEIKPVVVSVQNVTYDDDHSCEG